MCNGLTMFNNNIIVSGVCEKLISFCDQNNLDKTKVICNESLSAIFNVYYKGWQDIKSRVVGMVIMHEQEKRNKSILICLKRIKELK